jgi:hypothetical protein
MTAVLLFTILGAVAYVTIKIAAMSLHLFAVWAAGDVDPSAEAGGKPAKGMGS